VIKTDNSTFFKTRTTIAQEESDLHNEAARISYLGSLGSRYMCPRRPSCSRLRKFRSTDHTGFHRTCPHPCTSMVGPRDIQSKSLQLKPSTCHLDMESLSSILLRNIGPGSRQCRKQILQTRQNTHKTLDEIMQECKR